jgi:hypothetical protein
VSEDSGDDETFVPRGTAYVDSSSSDDEGEEAEEDVGEEAGDVEELVDDLLVPGGYAGDVDVGDGGGGACGVPSNLFRQVIYYPYYLFIYVFFSSCCGHKKVT